MSGRKVESSVTKIQELVYELNAGAAMAKSIITVAPETTMKDVRTLLKENRISGLPVVEDGFLIGIISLEDFIEWMADGASPSVVSEHMTRNVNTVFADEPLVHVVSTLEKHGFGRLPVLDRKNGSLVGIVTKGDIIETLLHELEIDYQEEEIRNYRASQFFDDLLADETNLNFGYKIAGTSIEQGGVVASSMKKTLKRLGVHPSVVRRVSIATYEAEMNVIIYAKSGHVAVKVDPETIEIDVVDSGPGIPDIDQARRAGYSTAPEWVRELGFGAGMGLPNIEACSENLEIQSEVGRGTKLVARFSMDERCA